MIVIFNYISVLEERAYYLFDENVIHLVRDARDEPFIRALEERVQEDHGCSFIDELQERRFVRDSNVARKIQNYLYCALCHLLCARHGNRATGYGGYSGGIVPALLMAEVLSFDDHRRILRPMLKDAETEYIRAYHEQDLASVLVDYSDTAWSASDLLEKIRQLAPNVCLKDTRNVRAFELLGPRDQLKEAIERLQRDGRLAIRTALLRKETPMHTELFNSEIYRYAFAACSFTRAQAPVYFSCGRKWRPEEGVESIPALFFENIFGNINTHAYSRLLRESGEALVVVGSDLVARDIFAATELRHGHYDILNSKMLE